MRRAAKQVRVEVKGFLFTSALAAIIRFSPIRRLTTPWAVNDSDEDKQGVTR